MVGFCDNGDDSDFYNKKKFLVQLLKQYFAAWSFTWY